MVELPKFTPTFHHEPYAAIDPSRPDLSLSGKSMLITGGAGVIGSATCRAFAMAQTKNIIAFDLDERLLSELKTKIETEFPKTQVHTYLVDIIDGDLVDKAFDLIEKDVGKVDILINNAAYSPQRMSLLITPRDKWWRSFEVNIKGNFNMTFNFLSRAPSHPILISISSCLAHLPNVPDANPNGSHYGHTSYSSSKIALTRVMELLAVEQKDARILSIHPGLIKSPRSTNAGNAGIAIDDREFQSCSNQSRVWFFREPVVRSLYSSVWGLLVY